MSKLKALDLFCGGGGTALGMFAAGFKTIVGVDIETHKHYPGDFVQAGVLNLSLDIHDFDFVWASPPCQMFSTARQHHKRESVNLIPQTRQILEGHPFTCIENVPNAPIRADIILSGPSVGLNRIIRVRHFECSFFMLCPPAPKQCDPKRRRAGEVYTITKSMCDPSHFYPRKTNGMKGMLSLDEAKEAMGIPLEHVMSKSEIGEAVPPAYSEFIAREVIKRIKDVK